MVSNILAQGLLGVGLPQMKFRIQKNEKGQFYWTAHRLTGNKEVFGISEMYTSKQSAQHSINLLKQFAASATVEDAA